MKLHELNQIRNSQLTEEELLMLKLHIDMSYTEIGKRLGYSRQYVHQLVTKAEEKVKLRDIEEIKNNPIAVIEAPKVKVDARNPDIQTVIDAFAESFGTTKHTKYDRFAAKRLHTKYTVSEVVRLIKALAAKSNEKYCPSVNSVSQLEDKLPQVVKFLQGQPDNTEVELW